MVVEITTSLHQQSTFAILLPHSITTLLHNTTIIIPPHHATPLHHTTSLHQYHHQHSTTPHHTTPHHTTPRHTIPHHTTPHYTTSHHTTPHHTPPHHTTTHHLTPHHTTPHHTKPHHYQAFKKLEAVNTSIVDLRPKVDEIINSESESSDLNQLKDTLSHVQELTEKVLVKVRWAEGEERLDNFEETGWIWV